MSSESILGGVYKNIMWERFNQILTAGAGSDWADKKLIMFGAGSVGKQFLQLYPQFEISYVLDSSPDKWGHYWNGLLIKAPDALENESMNDIMIFVASSFYSEIKSTLESFGFVEDQTFFRADHQSHSRIKLYASNYNDLFFALDWLGNAGVNYVVMRWFSELVDTPDCIEDVDILVKSGCLAKLLDCPLLNTNPPGTAVEVYWSDPFGLDDELIYYPPWLAEEILVNKVNFSGMSVPREKEYLNSLIYHVIFHKTEKSGVPLHNGTNQLDPFNKYHSKIVELAGDNLLTEVNLDNLWAYLDSVGWMPPLDLARRYAVNNDSPYLKNKCGPNYYGEGEMSVVVLRDACFNDNRIMISILRNMQDWGLELVQLMTLDESQKILFSERTRGGNWGESPGSVLAGLPHTLAIFFDSCPICPSEADLAQRPFLTNHRMTQKSQLKQVISEEYNSGEYVNYFHVSDDEREAWEYLDLLSDSCNSEIGRIRESIASLRAG